MEGHADDQEEGRTTRPEEREGGGAVEAEADAAFARQGEAAEPQPRRVTEIAMNA
jgi:hypothetical protein